MGAFAGVLQKMTTSALLRAVTAMINHPMDVINLFTKLHYDFVTHIGVTTMRMDRTLTCTVLEIAFY